MMALGRRGRAFFAHAGLSYVYQAVVAVQGFLLIPLYLHYMGAAYYGYWLSTGGALFALTFVNLGLAPAVNREIATHHAGGNNALASENFAVGAFLHVAMGALLMLLALGAASVLPGLLHFPPSLTAPLTKALLLAAGAFALAIFNDFARGAAAAALRPAPVTISLIVAQLLGIAVNIWLLLHGWGAVSIAAGMLATQAAAFIGNSAFILSHRSIFLQRLPCTETLYGILRIAPSMMGARFGLRLTQQIEPTLLSFFAGPEFVTLYMVNRKLCDLLDTATNVVWGALMMPLAHFLGTAAAPAFNRAVRGAIFTIVSLIAVMMTGYVLVDQSFVALWLSGKSAAPLTLILLIGLARVAESAMNCIAEMHTVMGDARATARGILLFVVARLVLAVGLLWLIGVNGLPIAVAIAGTVFALQMLGALKRIYNLQGLDWGRVAGAAAGVAAIVCAAGLITALLDESLASPWARLGTGAAIAAVPASWWLANRWKWFRNRTLKAR